jgi:hypothetical protein
LSQATDEGEVNGGGYGCGDGVNENDDGENENDGEGGSESDGGGSESDGGGSESDGGENDCAFLGCGYDGAENGFGCAYYNINHGTRWKIITSCVSSLIWIPYPALIHPYLFHCPSAPRRPGRQERSRLLLSVRQKPPKKNLNAWFEK